MLYNKEEHSRYVRMAGKISVAAAVVGFAVFTVAFLVDFGSQELSKVSAQTATTTLTVLNTPPFFAINAFEVPDSATTSPINTGDVMQWQATAVDSNGAPYFLLICSDSATPTPDHADIGNGTGIGEPRCDVPAEGGTAIQWGVSASAASGAVATVSTTTATTATSQFGERNQWFAWVCDDDAVAPRCSTVGVQGPTTTSASSSPFHVNNRPVFTGLVNDGPVDPSGELLFTSTSNDPDSIGDTNGGQDLLTLVVCGGAGDYNATTNQCDANPLATTTLPTIFTDNAAATRTIPSIIQDTSYNAFGFIVDEHGHEAYGNPIQANFTVNNVPPEVLGGDISLMSASSGNLTISVLGGETPDFTLDFTIRDANSCENVSAGDEIVDYTVSLFRYDEKSTTTCDGVTPGHYDPNDCYTSAVATTTWDLDCTASSTQCTGPTVDQLDFTCTFPLWFVTDPTDNGAETPVAFEQDVWVAAVAGIDDNASTTDVATSSSPGEVISVFGLDLDTAAIPYGELEPGDNTATLTASTTIFSVGNTGLDQLVSGEAMCTTFAVGNECPVSGTSTIPDFEQQFASTSDTVYNPLLATSTNGLFLLSSTSNQEVELDIEKSTATSTPNSGMTYWGIEVPITITLAGTYEGLNTFTGRTAEAADWTP